MWYEVAPTALYRRKLYHWDSTQIICLIFIHFQLPPYDEFLAVIIAVSVFEQQFLLLYFGMYPDYAIKPEIIQLHVRYRQHCNELVFSGSYREAIRIDKRSHILNDIKDITIDVRFDRS
ncbi:hypothetical protein TNCV_1836281 [Trichonephila clavipes]|nr:hypothetical protein TNCV_1836281 [Trichonephila clavipes]